MTEIDNETRDRANQVIETFLDNWRTAGSFMFNRCCRTTESPIEALFSLAVQLEFQWREGDCRARAKEDDEDYFTWHRVRSESAEMGEMAYWLWPQVCVNDRRVDFILAFRADSNGPVYFAVIECDGHNFHERTKRQAERDRSNDREFQRMGFLVLRYTGREIWRDAYECAKSAMHALMEKDIAAAIAEHEKKK